MEDIGEVSGHEEEYGIYQKDRVDDVSAVNIRAMNDHITFVLGGEGEYLEEDASAGDIKDVAVQAEGDKEIAWEEQTGPEVRTKFDQYYDARKAKNKKHMLTLKRSDW